MTVTLLCTLQCMKEVKYARTRVAGNGMETKTVQQWKRWKRSTFTRFPQPWPKYTVRYAAWTTKHC